MGLIYADITISNCLDEGLARRGSLDQDKIRKVKVKALIDSGAYMLCINENIKAQLGLEKTDEMLAEMANGKLERVEIVEPVDVKFENRSTSCRAAVLPGNSEVLMGSIPLEDMDVILLPKEQKLIVNPETPYIAKKKIK